jgi:hypothetical protein
MLYAGEHMKYTKEERPAHRKAFWQGWASAFDLSGGSADLSQWLPNLDDPLDGYKKDTEAIASDWRAVGDSLRWAMGHVDDGK